MKQLSFILFLMITLIFLSVVLNHQSETISYYDGRGFIQPYYNIDTVVTVREYQQVKNFNEFMFIGCFITLFVGMYCIGVDIHEK